MENFQEDIQSITKLLFSCCLIYYNTSIFDQIMFLPRRVIDTTKNIFIVCAYYKIPQRFRRNQGALFVTEF